MVGTHEGYRAFWRRCRRRVVQPQELEEGAAARVTTTMNTRSRPVMAKTFAMPGSVLTITKRPSTPSNRLWAVMNTAKPEESRRRR